MIWAILLGVVSLFVSLRYLFDDWWKEDVGQWFLTLAGSAGIGAVGFFIGVLGAMQVDQILPRQWTQAPVVQLSILRYEGNADQRFFLAIEGVGSDRHYSYFKKQPGAGYQPERLAFGDSVTVVEREPGSDSILHVYSYELTTPWFVWFGWNEVVGRRYEFFIPTGSLKVDS